MSNEVNNETFGMSIEKSICLIYNLDNDIDDKRTKKDIIEAIILKIKKYLEETKIKPIEYIGGGGYQDDFLLEDDTPENFKNLHTKKIDLSKIYINLFLNYFFLLFILLFFINYYILLKIFIFFNK